MPQIKCERAWWRPASIISSAAVAIVLTTAPTVALAEEAGNQQADSTQVKQEQVVESAVIDATVPAAPVVVEAETVTEGEGSLVENSVPNVSGVENAESGSNVANSQTNEAGSSSVTGGNSDDSNENASESVGDSEEPSNEEVDDGSVVDAGTSSDEVDDGSVVDAGTSSEVGSSASVEMAENVVAEDNTHDQAEGERLNGIFAISSALDSTKVLDAVNGETENGTYVQLYGGNGTAAQKWEVKWHEEDGGYYTIGIAGTDQVLDVEWGEAFSGANVWLYEYNGSDAQRWSIEKDDNGLWSILSHLGNFYLDVFDAGTSNGTKIWIYSGNGTNAQRFNFLQYKPDIFDDKYTGVSDGVYIINAASDESGKMVLDVNGASFNNGANVQIYEKNQSYAQRFYFQIDSQGFYTITNLGSGKVLDVAGAGIIPTTNIQQYVSNSTDAQKWAIFKDDEFGCIYLVNKFTGLALDVSWGKYSNGNNVWGYTFNRTEGQRWTLTESDFIEDGQIYVIYTASDTGKVLDIQNASSTDGAKLQAYLSNNTLAQRFEIQKAEGSNKFRIRTAASGGWLTVTSGNGVVQSGKESDSWTAGNTWTAVWTNGFFSLISAINENFALTIDSEGIASVCEVSSLLAGSQHFIFRPAQLISDGYYEIASALDEDLVLEVSGGNLASQSNVQISSKNDTNGQKFHIAWNGNSYVITAARSNFALDAEWGGTSNQTNVWIYNNNGSDAQMWNVEIADGGGVRFINRLSGLALDVSWGVSSPGTNVWLYEKNSGSGQVWKLTPTTVPYGWVQDGSTWKYYDRNGDMLTDSIVAYNLYQQIKNESSRTDYLIAVDAEKCHVVLFKGSAGNWELVFDALAGTGDPYLASTDTDGYGVTGEGGNPWGSLRGYFWLGGDPASGYTDSNGRREYDGGSQLKWFRSIYGEYGFHSTCGNYSDPSQVGKRLSHGCIRLLEKYAKMIYDLPSYTRVIVLPRYNGDFQIIR